MDELYVIARTVLLDALDALGEHRAALVLVGAQAVYLRVGEADLAVASYTTDGDLAVDPRVLEERPAIERQLLAAGFAPKSSDSVGMWITHRKTATNPETQVAVDLLVPEGMSPGTGRRSAGLIGHDSKVARKVKGLEGSLVDAEKMDVGSFVADDHRSFSLSVAGPAALLMSKVFKIQDRLGSDRLSDKDALDVYRLLRGTPTEDMASRYGKILGDARAEANAKVSLELLESQFGDRRSDGVQMALRAVSGLVDPEETATALQFLTKDLLHAVK
ncbi:hypothetical protein [Holophaga foetida]|uniref:hypothetical protein n=1 Tax=Holophaga foetida TaxID=35839 RepID=UPI00047D95A1|nr:hypothetical protein [Holophaga foetida]